MALSDTMDLPRPFGPYTLLRRLAVGGMAEVYVAKAKGIGGFEKLVAIKVIHPRYSEDDHFVTMLVDEAKLSVLLTHANIAQTFDLGCIEDGSDQDTYYIVMELVEGADTYKLLKRAAERPATIPLDICAYIASEMCHGLDYAHRKRDVTGAPLRIVHRDVSPQNVLVSFAGEVKVVDFGIAKATQSSGNTEVGVIKGKYYYMSPEQAWADPIDHRSDIFSAGIVLHELLTGDMVYQEDNLPKLLDRVRKAEIPPPSASRSDVPPELDAIVMKALRKEPEDRYASAHDFAQALTQFLYGHLPSFTPSRLAGMMGQLFPAEIDASSGVHVPSGQKVLSSIQTAESGHTSPASDSVEPMKADEFRPDPKKSVIFDLGHDFGDEQTSNQLPKALAAQRRASSTWDDATSGETPGAIAGTPAPQPEDEETWEDATVVDDSEDLMERMKELLEKQVAEKNRAAPPPSEERTLPFDRAKLPPAIRAKAEAALRRSAPAAPPVAPPRRPPPSAPPPPPTSGALAAARSAPPPPWPPEAPSTRETAPEPSADLPDLSGWRDASSEVRPAVGQRPDLSHPPSVVDTHQLAALQAEAHRRRKRLALIGAAAVGALVVFFLLVKALSAPDAEPPKLEVRSVPPGARVFFDGVELPGRTPLDVEAGIEVGQSYPVQVQLDGYEAWTRPYEASEGTIRHIAVLIPIKVSVTIRTEPEGGRVWVDGIDHGREPVQLGELPVGRELRIRARVDSRELRETRTITHESGEIVLRP